MPEEHETDEPLDTDPMPVVEDADVERWIDAENREDVVREVLALET
ncbi:MAG: hypothetical protein V1926_04595 [Candidatus Peregrinibacteria bacterium]